MAQTTLPAPRTAPRRRALFGLFDADGWGWASAKAAFWFVVIIILLGYIPDRAYYFTVGRTVELWPFSQFVQWSPVNLCPAENKLSVCPVPPGATKPWEISPAEVRLPAGRTDGGAVIVGTRSVYIGGTDGTTASADVFVADAVGTGNLSPWAQGPSLPEPRVDPAVVAVGNAIYVIGGSDASGAPTTTTYRAEIANDGAFSEWEPVEALALPEARTEASVAALADGIMLIGGADANGPVASVWVSHAAANGALGEWEPQNPLVDATADGFAAHVGDFVYLIGGRNAGGPSGGMQVLRVTAAAEGDGHGAAATPAPDAEAELPRWAVLNDINLPAPRANPAGFTINGVIYLIGGTDGTARSSDVWWTTPNADGTHDGWKQLDETDLGAAIEGASAVASGSHAFVIGGTSDGGVTADLARANLAPEDPFFQLGVLGATVPGLRIEGEIGQQLGYLNAATVGAVNFILLILIGVAYNHPARTKELWGRVRGRGRRR